MLLNLNQIKAITRGVVRVTEDNGTFQLFRFTEQQAQAYKNAGNESFYQKTLASAGVRLAFRTNSGHFSFDYITHQASSRKFAWFDVYRDGLLISHFGCEGEEQMDGHASIYLGGGTKNVEIYFPWSRRTDIRNVEIDDYAMLVGLHRKRTMLQFGDSITHGYDATYPSLSYASALARLLNADAVNKGIGGDVFFPALLDEPEPFSPDIISVAYGTNDWSHCTRADLQQNSREFYTLLSARYPYAKIYAITPAFRLDGDKKTNFGAPADTVDELIRDVCCDLQNVHVINGWHLMPGCAEFYSDRYLHPNDLGFGVYAQNLFHEIVNRW